DELRDSPQPWLDNRCDLSTLLGDLRGNAIASAALREDALFVSTKTGARYWIPEQDGQVAALLLRHYPAEGGELFPLGLFDTDGETPWYRDLLRFWPLALLLLGGGLFAAWRLRPYPVQRKHAGVTFADVVGAGEAKLALQDVTAYLKNPAAY